MNSPVLLPIFAALALSLSAGCNDHADSPRPTARAVSGDGHTDEAVAKAEVNAGDRPAGSAGVAGSAGDAAYEARSTALPGKSAENDTGKHANATAESRRPAADANSADKQAEVFFQRVFQAELDRSPEFQTYLGLKTNYGKWDELTETAMRSIREQDQTHLSELKEINRAALSPEHQLSYDLLKEKLEEQIEEFRWRYHDYPVNQMFGYHTETPAFLINQHQISSIEDAEAYIQRLDGIERRFADLQVWMEKQADKGIVPPSFILPKAISASKNVISGAPFTRGDDSTLWADFNNKLATLDLDEAQRKKLADKAEISLLEKVGPSYDRLIGFLHNLQARTDYQAGAWHLPDGDEYYEAALRRITTTRYSPDEIHEIGLKEVKRIHGEIAGIMDRVDFNGSLQDFFVFMQKDRQFYFNNDAEGRRAYLDRTDEIIDAMRDRLPELFKTLPQAELVVKPVEAFREKTAGEAFYQQPSKDGSRPGIYYANLHDMQEMPIYEMEALAYHEAIPGHHMQISIAQELETLPEFRKYIDYTVYSEGWGLYAEAIPKELGFYRDPYSDFGRLSMELLRACRLVVDTGLHSRRWTREQAIRYLVRNTPATEAGATKAIDRYIVMPGQATAYMLGMMKLVQLRDLAKRELGDQFDLGAYHDTVLRNGAVPLNVLESLVQDWIEGVRNREK